MLLLTMNSLILKHASTKVTEYVREEFNRAEALQNGKRGWVEVVRTDPVDII